ncbi:hypothetical protein [Methylobacterium sp. WL120]|uniref:hypothetical protein n=1 Tax=Methylobacterium sp. WL120 TaxID=2603887 RepID=UPI001FEFBB17|nr:hypothetical protein [Methylobacterium sp. WL120]
MLPVGISIGALTQELTPADNVPATPRTTGTVIAVQPNTTGNDRDLVISRGATGAETTTMDSAAGGNARLPERAVPNGSAGGGSSSGGGG